MSTSFTPRKLPVLLGLVPLLLSAPSFASHHDHHDDKDGHAIVRDVEKPGTRIEFDEDQDEVYRAVQKAIFALSLICMKQWRMICMGVLLK